jgi:peptidyl-prolyl cis-trans isomerase-like 4
MDGVLIDDHRIHVDFSQSVSKIADDWRDVTNKKRRRAAGGFGGIDNLEKKTQYRGRGGREIVSDSVVNNLVVDRDVAPSETKPRDDKERRSDGARRREQRQDYHDDRWKRNRSRSKRRERSRSPDHHRDSRRDRSRDRHRRDDRDRRR